LVAFVAVLNRKGFINLSPHSRGKKATTPQIPAKLPEGMTVTEGRVALSDLQ